MKARFVRAMITLTSAILLTALSAYPVLALEEFRFAETKTFEVGPSPEIQFETVSGDLSYTGAEGTSATVDVVIVVRARDQAEAEEIRDELKITVAGSPGSLVATAKQRRDFGRWLEDLFGKSRWMSVTFHARGPHGATGTMATVSGMARVSGVTGSLDLETVSGDIEATSIGGRLTAESVSGSLDITDCGAPMRVETVSGDIMVNKGNGDFRANTVSGLVDSAYIAGAADVTSVSGDVRLRSVQGSVTASTVSGEIDVEQETGAFDLETTSGDIVARSSKTSGMLVAESVSGSIEVYVNPENIGDVLLASPSGEIRVETGLRLRRHSRSELTGTLGNGDGSVEISTSSGDILLGEL